MSATGKSNSCPSCRGHGWKFVTLRRSAANAGGTAERGLLRRARVSCLTCSGSGRVSAT
jgi:DnaJ-class molecular chaperone